jgi:hypothetical protein
MKTEGISGRKFIFFGVGAPVDRWWSVVPGSVVVTRKRGVQMLDYEPCPECGDTGDKTLDETPHGDLLWVCQACGYTQ